MTWGVYNIDDFDLDKPIFVEGVFGTPVCIGTIDRVSSSQDLRSSRPTVITYDVNINDDGIKHHAISSTLINPV